MKGWMLARACRVGMLVYLTRMGPVLESAGDNPPIPPWLQGAPWRPGPASLADRRCSGGGAGGIPQARWDGGSHLGAVGTAWAAFQLKLAPLTCRQHYHLWTCESQLRSQRHRAAWMLASIVLCELRCCGFTAHCLCAWVVVTQLFLLPPPGSGQAQHPLCR